MAMPKVRRPLPTLAPSIRRPGPRPLRPLHGLPKNVDSERFVPHPLHCQRVGFFS